MIKYSLKCDEENCNENEPFDGKSGPKTYDFTLQFPNQEYSNEAAEKFLTNFKALENYIKNLVFQLNGANFLQPQAKKILKSDGKNKIKACWEINL